MLERRFVREPDTKDKYVEFLQEYENLDHMQQVKDEEPGLHYYIPHHAVIRPESKTTKLRVVFDVSFQLIGFADVSAQAYGACLYVKSENANETQIRLLCSKTRVAPLKTWLIPRLELLAATLATKIVKIID
ncbi:integrase catalytic domain-containing protein [Trichonephila clavipes]|uniref:Integrase catalytic domain-containing protein n=1 Tax=Trichonephila clavipes TaxID=2585209 RepID=A0A8X6V342_TRICX|nr:integrase catalytic domain-containing protein [Trichonephila clavipes]